VGFGPQAGKGGIGFIATILLAAATPCPPKGGLGLRLQAMYQHEASLRHNGKHGGNGGTEETSWP
jgi:hypothetical protein